MAERPVAPWETSSTSVSSGGGRPTAPWESVDGRPAAPWEYDTDLQRKASVLEKVLNVLSIPTNIGAGAVSGALSGEGVVEGVKSGLKEHKTYGDVLQEQGVENPWIRIPVGFAADVALDPLTYTGIGALTKAGKAAKGAAVAAELAGDLAGAAKFGTTMAEQAARGERALLSIGGKTVIKGAPMFKGAAKAVEMVPGAEKAAMGWRKAFDPLAVKGLTPVQREAHLIRLQEIEGAQNLARKHAVEVLAPRVKRIREVAAAIGKNPDEVERLIFEAAERPGAVSFDAVPPELRGEVSSLIDDARNILDTDLAAKQASGIKVAIESDLPYFPHVASGEMNQAMREAGGGGTLGAGREITEAHAQQLRRAFVDPNTGKQLSRNEANDILRLTGTDATGGVPSAGGFLGLASGTAEAHVRSARAIKSAEVMQDYARNYGRRPVDKAEAAALRKQGWASVPNDLEGVGEGVLFPKPVAEALSMMHQGVFNPKGPLGDALRGFDALTNGWKSITLGLFPSFHTRNELDDLFRATAYGGMDPRIIQKAIQVQVAGTRLARDADPSFKLGGKSYTAAELKRLALKHNVTDSGLVGDLAEHMDLAVKKGNVVGRATDLGRRVGTARENSTRMALFMDRLAKGDTPEVAGLFTNKILINYTLKTRFEREVMQRIFPFYMYTSRNMPIQFEYLLKKPGVAAGVQKAREEFAGDQQLGIEDAQLPEFLARGLPIRLGTGEDGAAQFGRIEGQLGISDLNTPFNAINKAVGLINPFISTPLEMASNRDFFTQRKLEEYPGQSRNVLGVPVSSRWAAPPVELVRLLSEINRANPGNVFGTKDAGPVWNPELRREYEQPSGLMRAMNTLIGRAYPVTDERAQASTNFAREQRINELKSRLRRAATPGEKEKIMRELEAVASGAALVPLK